MKRLFILSAFFLYAATSMAQTVSDTVIIAWKKKNLTTQQETLFDTLQLQIYNLNDVRYFKKVTPGYTAWNNYYHIRCSASADTVFGILGKSGLFDTIYYDKKVGVECSNPVATNDPLNNTYVNDMLGLPCAWSLTTGNPNHTVGLIDSDFQQNLHSDLWGKVNDSYETGDFTSGGYYKGSVPPAPGTDSYHGLVMSGIIAAIAGNSLGLCGAAYNTKLNLYDYSTAGSGNYHSEVTSALNFAAQNGEKVVNISLRYCAGENEDFVSFHNWVVNQGTTVVYSAGNEREDYLGETSLMYEGVYEIPGIIIVSSVNEDNKTYIGANNSNYHACSHIVEICAPGYDITSTYYDGTIGATYKTDASGTSCSAAFVSSAIALMLAADNTLTPAQVEEILLTTADSISDFDDANNYTNLNFGEDYTAGRLNTYHAVYKALNYNDCETAVINSGQQISWNAPVFICGTLTVNGQLTISAPVHFLSNNAEIEINDGGRLIIDNGGEIILWEDETYNRNIIVNPGGSLEVKNGGSLTLSDYGKIDIMYDATQDAELIYNQGATIELLSNKTYINIAGNLTIAANAQFTFTGAGYIKFSNPGDDWTENITCGSGSSIYLHGSGQSDKVLEVQQNTVRFPAMTSLTFEDCKIEMGTSKRMLSTANYPITFDNVLLTSTTGSNNAHRSFYFYGQSNAVVQNSIFENGLYGLKGELNNFGAKLYIDNCEFRNNSYGLYLYNKGVDASNSSFHDNSLYGTYCTNMSFTSSFLSCDFTDNGYGIYYQGSSSADLDIESCDISSNTNDGIKTSGALDINLACNNINENNNGVYTSNGTLVYANNNAKNDMSLNTKTIIMGYGRVFLDEGYNQLQSINDSYTIYGTVVERANCGITISIPADRNRWESSLLADPEYGTNYLLDVHVVNCLLPTHVDLTDVTPSYTICYDIEQGSYSLGGMLPNGAQNDQQSSVDLPLLSFHDIASMSLDESVDYLAIQTETISSQSEFDKLIGNYISLIDLCSNLDTDVAYQFQTKAYGDVHRAIVNYYLFTERNSEHIGFNEAVDKMIIMNENLLLDLETPDLIQIEYKLDIALLNRLRGQYDKAITQLEILINEINEPNLESEKIYAENWLCHIKAEKELTEGTIAPDEFDAAIAECSLAYPEIINETDQTNLETEETIPSVTITINPNPNQGSFTVQVVNSKIYGKIMITNSTGQPVYETVLTLAEQIVNVNGLPDGTYTVYYLENGIVISSSNLVVE